MKNQFTLEINKPCSQNFNKFTPTKAGGFCGSCHKEVIDFTEMSSHDIINYFKNNANKETCGRLTNYQLGNYTESITKPKFFTFWKGLGLACLSIFAFNTLQAQETKPKTEISATKTTNEVNTQQENIFVKGTVTDQNGSLPGVSIVLKGTTIGTETDFEGKFEFPKPLKKGDILIFSFIGMDSQEIVINSNATSNVSILNVKMKGEYILMGKVAVKKVYTSKKSK